MADLPGVSVFMTVRDEERDLRDCVERILAQEYDGDLELVVAVGPSKDRTAEIAAGLAREHAALTVVQNPAGWTPQGLNAAVGAARHDLLVRADGHALLPPDYVARVVDLLLSTGAANVGGRMQPQGTNTLGRAVARAMSSRWGIGGAAFHTGGEPGPQPTVYLGSFRRDALEAVGGYDEFFRRAQDWELNHRLREAGETIWFDPSLAVVYHPRSTWRSFARQQYTTGGWRRRVVERHPRTLSLRYLAPPAATAAVVGGTVAGVVGLVGPRWLRLGFSAPVAYAAGVTVVGLREGADLDPQARRLLPAVLATMHLSWGAGFLRRA
ncbi:glycosyltransferase family 2 protein [Solicola sp. PLA-1-18]|uniref:glycosyltransferase family 2 protein n=1 Tax=Solicola sp. PLA-1-18 TaxID=3380532 RepID=UPI003B78DD49